MENTNTTIDEIMDTMKDNDVADVAVTDMLPTVEEATANAVGTFGVREGLVVGFFTLGLACMGYTAYDLGYKKLFKGTLVPYFQQRKAMKEAMKAGAAEAAKNFQTVETQVADNTEEE
jgi:hypothetical protein